MRIILNSEGVSRQVLQGIAYKVTRLNKKEFDCTIVTGEVQYNSTKQTVEQAEGYCNDIRRKLNNLTNNQAL